MGQAPHLGPKPELKGSWSEPSDFIDRLSGCQIGVTIFPFGWAIRAHWERNCSIAWINFGPVQITVGWWY